MIINFFLVSHYFFEQEILMYNTKITIWQPVMLVVSIHKQPNKLKNCTREFFNLSSCFEDAQFSFFKLQQTKLLMSFSPHPLVDKWNITTSMAANCWSTLSTVLDMQSSPLVPVVSWCQQKPSLYLGCISWDSPGRWIMCPYSRWYLHKKYVNIWGVSKLRFLSQIITE